MSWWEIPAAHWKQYCRQSCPLKLQQQQQSESKFELELESASKTTKAASRMAPDGFAQISFASMNWIMAPTGDWSASEQRDRTCEFELEFEFESVRIQELLPDSLSFSFAHQIFGAPQNLLELWTSRNKNNSNNNSLDDNENNLKVWPKQTVAAQLTVVVCFKLKPWKAICRVSKRF